MLRRFFIICLAVTLSVTLVLVGCSNGPKGTIQDVKLGMTKAEVLQIMGKPQERETKNLGSFTDEVLRWRFKDQTVVLMITKDRVSGKQMSGPARKAQDS